jgi:protoporphyrinogen oxidase
LPKTPDKVIILGAGPAGLSAAWKLSAAGVPVEVIEAEPLVGGQCRTTEHDGFRFDLGGHRFISNDREVLDEIRALMGGDLLVRPRKSTIKMLNSDLNYPLEPLNLVKALNPLISAKCFFDYLFNLLRTLIVGRRDADLEDWIVHRFGRSLYNLYLNEYLEKLWGKPATEISSEWAAQRITLLNLGDVLLRLLKIRRSPIKTYATEFYYPRLGIGQIYERIAEVVTGNGGTIHLNSEVVEIQTADSRVTGVTYVQGGETRSIQGEHFITTIPLPEFVRCCRPVPDVAALDAAAPMRFRGIRFLNLLLDMPRVTENTWIYVPYKKDFFFRIEETANWSPSLVPEGKTGLVLEISCNCDDEIWNMPEEDVVERCLTDLKNIRMDVRDRVVGHFSNFLAEAYPIYFIGYAEKRNQAYEFLNRFDNLTACGRQGLYRYNNMDHSIKMGFLAARHLTEGADRDEIYRIAGESKSFEPLASSIYRSDKREEI